MNRLQKMALFNLLYLGVSLFASVVVLTLILYHGGMKDFWKHLAPVTSLCCLILLVLLAVQSWPNRKKLHGKILFDERDKMIQIKAMHQALWGFFSTFLWMMWLVIPPKLYACYALPILLASATLIGMSVYSLSVLIQYRTGDKDGR